MDKRILESYDNWSLDRAVFSKQPKPRHVERMENPIENGLIHTKAENAPVQVPPSNSSSQTRQELLQMARDIEAVGKKKQQKIVSKYDSGFEWKFEKICKDLGIKWNKEYVDRLIEESGDIILQLKYKWNRPRPFQLAPMLGIEMNVGKAYTAGTPSFPSGHSAQSQLIADVLSKVYPLHRDAFQTVPEKVSYSRYIGGLHFPSDIEYGKQIGHWLASHTNTDSY